MFTMHVLLITTLRAEQTYFRKKRRLYTKRETTVRAKSDVCLQTRTYIYETRGIRAITWRHVIIITTLRAECVVMCAHLSLSVLIYALSSSVLKYNALCRYACRICRYVCSFVVICEAICRYECLLVDICAHLCFVVFCAQIQGT